MSATPIYEQCLLDNTDYYFTVIRYKCMIKTMSQKVCTKIDNTMV